MDFCPMKVGQKSVKSLVGFLGDLKIPKIHSEINWPLTGEYILWKENMMSKTSNNASTLFL